MNTSGQPQTPEQIRATLTRIARDYPPGVEQLKDVERIAFHLELISPEFPAGARVADIGGGLGLFPPGAAALGYTSILVDDFQDRNNITIAEDTFTRIHRKLGVEIDSRDVVTQGVAFAPESLDVVTTFDSIEHWHSSPKPALHQLMAALKPGGKIIIGLPNCVNLRKRVTVPLGINKWSDMEEWYEAEVFRGHVREPSVADLHYMARDLGLVNTQVIGRNWLGYANKNRWVRMLTPVADAVLTRFPTLCSDLYLIGYKPR